MKSSQVSVPWREGLHLRAAVNVVKRSQGFKSDILIKLGGKVADGKSILSILILCAAMGSLLDVEATGPDEREAVSAIETLFAADDVPGN